MLNLFNAIGCSDFRAVLRCGTHYGVSHGCWWSDLEDVADAASWICP